MLQQALLLRNDAFDFLKHAIDARHYIAGRETDDAKVVFVQPGGASRIVKSLRRLGMLIAVDFNHQPNRKAAEICEVWTQRKLATKAVAMSGFAAEIPP